MSSWNLLCYNSWLLPLVLSLHISGRKDLPSLLFSRLNQVQLFLVLCFSLLIILLALCWTCSVLAICAFWFGGTNYRHSFQPFMKAMKRETIPTLNLQATLLLVQSSVQLVFIPARASFVQTIINWKENYCNVHQSLNLLKWLKIYLFKRKFLSQMKKYWSEVVSMASAFK